MLFERIYTMLTKLKNMKIRSLIFVSIGILVACIVVTGISAIYYTNSIAGQTNTLYAKPHTNLVNMWQTKTVILSGGDSLKTSVLLRQALSSDAFATPQNLSALLEGIDSNRVAATRSADMEKLMQYGDNLNDCFNRVAELISQNKFDEAQKLLLEEFVPLQSQTVSAVDSIITTATNNAIQFKNNANAMALHVRIYLIVLSVLAVALSMVVLAVIVKGISTPLKALESATRDLVQGNLSHAFTYQSKNEFGVIARGFQEIQESMRKYVSNISYVLDKIADKDLTVSVDIDYIGDFAPIRQAMDFILSTLRQTLYQIDVSADQVLTGSQQVASSAQALAAGATEQASSVEELSATAGGISSQVTQLAEQASSVNLKTQQTGEDVALCNQKMADMSTAIGEISNKSSEIGKIIKTIEDIAFQTNILALNAAVEAARAGEAGKGFAVVADEVRNLANKSAEAAKNTTALIEESLRAVENGTRIAEDTATALAAVVDVAQQASKEVNGITSTMTEEASAIEQISIGIDQITSVVQNNSATSEQSAAASEELSGQAQELKRLVDEFQLPPENTLMPAGQF